jgi:hypothetical protein
LIEVKHYGWIFPNFLVADCCLFCTEQCSRDDSIYTHGGSCSSPANNVLPLDDPSTQYGFNSYHMCARKTLQPPDIHNCIAGVHTHPHTHTHTPTPRCLLKLFGSRGCVTLELCDNLRLQILVLKGCLVPFVKLRSILFCFERRFRDKSESFCPVPIYTE